MSKKLAIKGHPTRGKEVIELLKMMGGAPQASSGFRESCCYYISEYASTKYKYISWDYIGPEEIDKYEIFTLEEFLGKYPFKIGDKVIDKADGCPGIVNEMKWDEDVSDMKYCVAFANGVDFGWFVNNSIEFCKETDTVKPVTNKSERTHEDVIFDSIIWHLRNSVNNGKQNLSGGECEDYFREVVKKNNENKMSDCKKCGLGFGSVRCFDKDCPHNTPKSYAVGLKDGKVIDCIENKKTDMNEIKPLFKAGDVVKLKGDPDENLFWIVMDVVKDGYIFNDAKKIPFDEQHHYEKSNREVINIQPSKMKNVLAELLEHIKTTPKEELEREFEEIKEWSNVGPTVEEFMTFCECVNKKPVYPTTYDECSDILNADEFIGYEFMINFPKLINARNAYWKIAGEEMGLGKPWEPAIQDIIWGITRSKDEIEKYSCHYGKTNILEFPTEEMLDAFYENFKDLIEQCKELL